ARVWMIVRGHSLGASMSRYLVERIAGQADLPHPALGQDVTPSPTTGRDQAGSGVRARSARKGARVDKLATPNIENYLGFPTGIPGVPLLARAYIFPAAPHRLCRRRRQSVTHTPPVVSVLTRTIKRRRNSGKS